ncbi:MAG TPA: hypothetical protein DDW90_01575 [Cyanobacteria bacterium UBA9971]|nr:hypothetical protein [Cyanobacteria bacterium UBA9971]
MDKQYKIEWDENFAWGIKEIDDQHKDIIKSVNNLYTACEENTVKEVILDLIEELDNYVTIHFDTEENYAKKFGFEKNIELLSDHAFFKNLYQEIKNYYTIHYTENNANSPQYKYTYIFALHLNQTLVEWLNVHLNTIDRELGDFLKGKI